MYFFNGWKIQYGRRTPRYCFIGYEWRFTAGAIGFLQRFLFFLPPVYFGYRLTAHKNVLTETVSVLSCGNLRSYGCKKTDFYAISLSMPQHDKAAFEVVSDSSFLSPPSFLDFFPFCTNQNAHDPIKQFPCTLTSFTLQNAFLYIFSDTFS